MRGFQYRLASKSFYLIFALPGVVAEYRRHREKRFIAQLVLLGIVYFVFYTGVGCWHSGWTRYFRYHESWFPLLTVFATVGMYDIYRILQRPPKLLVRSNEMHYHQLAMSFLGEGTRLCSIGVCDSRSAHIHPLSHLAIALH